MDFNVKTTRGVQNGGLKILLKITNPLTGRLRTSAEYSSITLTIKERDVNDPNIYNDLAGLTNITVPLNCVLDTPGTYNNEEYNFKMEAGPSLPTLFPKRRWSYIIHIEFTLTNCRPSVYEHEIQTQ